METAIVFSKLLLAHLLGDFVLQPTSWVAEKESRRWRSLRLYLHMIVHMLISYVLLWDFNTWPYVLLIGGSHYLIDLLKIYFQKRRPRLWFLLDQVLHILVLSSVCYLYVCPHIEIDNFIQSIPWLHITAFIFVTYPASVFIKVFFLPWTFIKLNERIDGLKSAGQWIGIMERILILTFIIVNQWEAVGFLLAAKSIFRFGDLKDNKEVYLTEYILIGTLISFSIAIFTGIALNYFTA